MARWVKNVDNKVRSVQVGNGNVVAVAPQGVVEIVAETADLRRQRRWFIPTGRPVHEVKVSTGVAAVGAPAELRGTAEFYARVHEWGDARTAAEAKQAAAMRAAQRAAAAADAGPEASPADEQEETAAPVVVEPLEQNADAMAEAETEETEETGAVPEQRKRKPRK